MSYIYFVYIVHIKPIHWSIYLFIRFQVPFKEEMIAELKFLLKFGGYVKPVRHRKNSSLSQQSDTSDRSYDSRKLNGRQLIDSNITDENTQLNREF